MRLRCFNQSALNHYISGSGKSKLNKHLNIKLFYFILLLLCYVINGLMFENVTITVKCFDNSLLKSIFVNANL